MRILMTTHYYAEHRGGVEIIAEEVGRRLARRGAEVVWAASGPAPARTGTRSTRASPATTITTHLP